MQLSRGWWGRPPSSRRSGPGEGLARVAWIFCEGPVTELTRENGKAQAVLTGRFPRVRLLGLCARQGPSFSAVPARTAALTPPLHQCRRFECLRRVAQVLYSEQVIFGYHNPLMSATQLPSDKKYYFKDFTALMADKPRAFEGWRQGKQAISDHIAQRLTAK